MLVKAVFNGVNLTTISIIKRYFNCTKHSKITKTLAKTFEWRKSYYFEFRCM